MEELQDHINQLKKAELHVHLEGSLSHETFKKLAIKHNSNLSQTITLAGSAIPLPKNLVESYPSKLNFQSFIAIYLKITSIIKDQEDVILIANDYLESCKKQNITHSQVYFSPTTHLMFEKKIERLYEGLVEAQNLAKNRYGQVLRFIFDIVRNSNVPGEKTIEMALEARKRGVDVFAIGLAGHEAQKEAHFFSDDFKKARSLGFETLAHAGETLGAENIWQTIRKLGVRRIGHGVRAIEDEKLLDYLAKNEIVLEVSPWSNASLGIFSEETQPIKKLIDRGINVVISSDDPGIFQKTLSDNFLFAAKLGVDSESLEKIASLSLKIAN